MDKKKPVALIDLDGTLADHDGQIQRDLQEFYDSYSKVLLPHITPSGKAVARTSNVLVLDDAQMEEFRETQMNRIGWWRNLPPISQGFRVVQMFRDLGFKLHVCTRASSRRPDCWKEKIEWCNQHIPDAKVTITQDKALVYGKVLMDDWPDYVEPWLRVRPRGLVIMPDREWNRDFKDHPRVIRHTEFNDAEVRGKLDEFLKGQ